MPLHEFTCRDKHTTLRVIKLADKLPYTIRCTKCKKTAKRAEVYKVSVGGDLPTRGAF